MRILLVTPQYPPNAPQPAKQAYDLARHWKALGMDVCVLTSKTDGTSETTEPDTGIPIIHENFPTSQMNIFHRYMAEYKFANTFKFQGVGFHKSVNIVYLISPCIATAKACIKLAEKIGAKFIFSPTALYPNYLIDKNRMLNKADVKKARAETAYVMQNIHALIASSQQTAKWAIGSGAHKETVYYIPHSIGEDEVRNAEAFYTNGSKERLRNELQLNPLTKVLLYGGTLGINQSVGQIIDGARALMNRSDFLILFVGDGDDLPRIKTLSKGLPNIVFEDKSSKHSIWSYYALADACFVTQKDISSLAAFVPTKTVEIMASGTPIIAAIGGAGADVLIKSGCALVSAPEDSEKLANNITRLLDSPSLAKNLAENGKKYVAEHLLLTGNSKQYLSIFNHIIMK
jgi:glycosyltransferase involved in cell wall biosynthesis